MKNLRDQAVRQEAILEIEKIAPKHSEVAVDFEKNRKGLFSTHIRLITKQKIYFAKKEDMFLNKSFYKAMRAIKAQIKKNKIDHHAEKYSLFA